jgi:glycosyltransferase involved in cell wall biosynthesis
LGLARATVREMVRIKIGWLGRYSQKKSSLYGGKAYEMQLLDFLLNNYEAEEIYPHSDKKNELLRWAEELYRLSKLNISNDIFIRDFYSSAVMGKTTGRNISVIHHIDSSQKKHPFLNKLLEKKFYMNLNRIDTIVTVSEYWKRYLEEMGHGNVRVVYNGFNLRDFEISDEEVERFKKKYGLSGKPIIYLGNCQPGKGVVEAYQELKDRDAFLATSGEEKVKIPAMNLNLYYKEYLTLLKVSSVVIAMSKFNEGWNRSVHEAMLCKTPVIGSGLGGMKELLDGGKQIICEDVSKLSYLVDVAMESRGKQGERGYNCRT